jgi:hypothetical protein
MRIKIIGKTYLGRTAGVKVHAVLHTFLGKATGYLVLGKDLVDVGVYNDIDPEYEYFLRGNQVKVIQS